MKSALVALAVAGFLVGCSDVGDTIINPSGKVSATTDKTAYSVGEKIAVTLKNDSRSAVYFGHCNYRIGFWIERKDNDTWVDAGSIAILCLAIYPSGKKELASGSVSRDTISLMQSGTYRLRFPIVWLKTDTIGDSLFSNEFVVHGS